MRVFADPSSTVPDGAARPRVRVARVAFALGGLLALLWTVRAAFAAEGYDVLAECMALTGDEDEIHGCLDNYLDVMDDNIGDLEAFLERELDGEARAGFARSQSAFASYRRENCLWYLEFNEPRANAEKIAKNCLARMSLARLSELQSLLVRDEGAGRAIDGFYVYGANRNSFRPCGSDARYWVEGDAAAVGTLQRGYASLATADLQVMFASLVGGIDEGADAPIDHDGVLRARSVRDVRVPSDGDCRLPDGSPPVTSVAAAAGAEPSTSVAERVADVPPREADVDSPDTGDDREAIARSAAGSPAPDDGESTEGWIVYSGDPPDAARANPVADPDGFADPGPDASPVAEADPVPAVGAPAAASAVAPAGDERLTAYFGAWLADCESGANGRRCRVAVDLGDGGEAPELALLRRGPEDTTVEVAFPDRAIDAASDVDWAIDGYAFGGAGGGEVSVGDGGTVLRLADRRFVGEDLLPLMRRGSALALDVRAGDGSVERLEGTLVGLTRALGFADGFLTGEGS